MVEMPAWLAAQVLRLHFATMPTDAPDFDAEYSRIFELWTDDAMSGISPAEQDFIIANVCVNESLNGGLMQYYENSYGERAHNAADIFDRIGVPQAAKLLRRANRLMGVNGPSRDQAERSDQLEQLSDEALEEMVDCSDALNELEKLVRQAALRWVQQHR